MINLVKSIKLSEYNTQMGKLIILDKEVLNKVNIMNYNYIPYNDLIFNHSKYLNKNDAYFLLCSGGIKSKKAANILTIYGYNVTNLVK